MEKLILLERELISIRKDINDLKQIKGTRWQVLKLKLKYKKKSKQYRKLLKEEDL